LYVKTFIFHTKCQYHVGDRGCMVVGFPTTCAISAYHH